MSKSKKITIEVKGTAIAVVSQKDEDYISLADIAKYRNRQEPFAIINNWMRGGSTIEFLGLWEKLSNPDFKPLEFDGIRMQAGLNSFALTPKQWIEKTGAIGVAGYEPKTLDGFLSRLRYLRQIRSLKTAFMQDLLTGKKRATALLNDTEVARL